MVSQRQGQRNAGIESSRLLLVEGNDDRHFFQRLIGRRQNSDIQVIEYGGEARLGDFLANTLVADPGLSDLAKVMGVVRDADDSYQGALQSVQDSLRRANLPVPATPLTYGEDEAQGTTIQVVAYIMPDNGSPGDLETLCLDAVRSAPAMPCVDRYFNCLQSISQVPTQESKARLRAFLAANPADPTLLTGNAIAAGVIPWNSPAFAGVHQFLDMLDAVN